MIYLTVSPDAPLTQGDLLDGCRILRHTDGDEVDRISTRVIVLTQACDLAQHKADWVVVATVVAAEKVVGEGTLKASAVRDQVRLGRVFGWYYLPAAPEPIPVPESIVNLRDLHTVPRSLLEKLAADGKRPARLNTPYREHLAQHFAVSYMRIALPEQFATRG
ncbi:MAG: hypothetical protein ACOVT5_05510 [Armatimonadaceae bacterium]|jgi:hypothetical protein